MQDFDARRQVYGGTSNSRLLGAGTKFTLGDFPDTAANQEYLVTESVCSVQRAETRAFEAEEDLPDTFRCVLRAVPSSRPFRLPDLTPRPLIRGPQTARVTGESGQEVTTDQYGRIKVKFPWDRSTVQDQNSSCWIRVAQGWAGQSWGAMFIPRVGQEVVVEFLEGNPDRPLVTGAVYNADMTVPYALPDNKTRSTVKTNSSTGGGGFNEWRFEDKKGEEEVFFQAQKDFNETILNNHTATIKKDTTTTVEEGNRIVTVSQGDDTHTISQGNRSVTVSQGNASLTVGKGNRTVDVSTGNNTLTVSKGNHSVSVPTGKVTIEALQSITLKVGPSSIEITPDGIKLDALMIKVTASTQLEMSGAAMAKLVGGIVMIN